MLKARNVERNFQSYPPYWVYRAMTAQALKNDKEASECFDKFDEIWRPVLRYDPYKLEAEKYRVQSLAAKENHDNAEIKKHLDIVRDYTPDDDWGNNIFAGVTYFLLGENEEGISCVEPNVDFEYETDVSNIFLSEMKKGKLDAFALFALQEDLKKAIEKAQATTVKMPMASEQSKPTEKKQTSGKRSDLTKDDIIRIGQKYGYCTHVGNISDPAGRTDTYGIPSYVEIYDWDCPHLNRFYAICSDGIYCTKGFWTTERFFISYTDLRNLPSASYISQKFESYPNQFISFLIGLYEFEE